VCGARYVAVATTAVMMMSSALTVNPASRASPAAHDGLLRRGVGDQPERQYRIAEPPQRVDGPSIGSHDTDSTTSMSRSSPSTSMRGVSHSGQDWSSRAAAQGLRTELNARALARFLALVVGSMPRWRAATLVRAPM
jgi:hypothetical protein